MLPFKIYTRKKIFKYYTGISFFIFVWICRLEKNEARLMRHETIHFWQQVEMFFIFHWLFYLSFYIVSRIKGHGHYIAYRYNPFELEAYQHDADEQYLVKRKPYAWLPFVVKYYQSLNQDLSANIPRQKEITW